MNYLNTSNPSEVCSFKEALLNGLASNKGLYVPEQIPVLPTSFFDSIIDMSQQEIAYEVLFPFVKNEIPSKEFKEIIEDTFHFPIPTIPLNENIFVTELFHGPTQAFKDIGAKFMAKCLNYFQEKDTKSTVLVATSGDTGSAVANGFFNEVGVEVRILFPKNKVSPYQEYQMTSLGKNIKAIEVDGTFDDCQALVKEAFSNPELKQRYKLTSANSINIARLLPQMLFYFITYRNMKQNKLENNLVISVPCGNLGNLTAGLYAKKMGLPIHRYIAALNKNDAFGDFLNSKTYQPKETIETISNAMDVGNPSNIERIIDLYKNNSNELRCDIKAYSFSDSETLNEIQNAYEKSNYILDPHGSIGVLALKNNLNTNEIGVALETAHPCKFESVIQKVIATYPNKEVDLKKCSKTSIQPKLDLLIMEL
jgi:threonine synthase